MTVHLFLLEADLRTRWRSLVLLLLATVVDAEVLTAIAGAAIAIVAVPVAITLLTHLGATPPTGRPVG